jgi:pyridoxal phosphate enzyme, YggS family
MTDSPGNRLADRLAALRGEVDACARAAGRDPATVRILAVSKTHPAPRIDAALAAGQRDFGESRLQELLAKQTDIAAAATPVWHFIGRLQGNKARAVAAAANWVHSLDRVELLPRLAPPPGRELHVLLQINLSGAGAQGGLAPDTTAAALEHALATRPDGVRLRGLMAIGPADSDESECRRCFARLRTLRERLATDFDLPDFDQLSMGMSGDWPAAVREGATWIRIGSHLFGERDYGPA